MAQPESARKASELNKRVTQLQADVQTARGLDNTAEVRRLEAQLAKTRSEADNLESTLRQREKALASAQAKAEESQTEAERLRNRLEASEAAQVAKAPSPTPAVPPQPVVQAPLPAPRLALTRVTFVRRK